MKRVFCVVLIASMIGMVGCGNNIEHTESNEKTTTEAEESKDVIEVLNEEVSKATYEDFINLKVGQTYKEVTDLLGEANKYVKSGNKETYVWEGEDGKGISVEVDQNDVVISKSQSNLKERCSANVNIDMFNQLQDGMTVEETQAILGEGKLTYEQKEDSFVKTMYAYYNEDNSSIILTFRDYKLYSKVKNNLD